MEKVPGKTPVPRSFHITKIPYYCYCYNSISLFLFLKIKIQGIQAWLLKERF